MSNAFKIGKFEVTIGQYTAFLNAVARTNPNSYIVNLWNGGMMTNPNVSGIHRTGGGTTPNPYNYASVGNTNQPVAYVSWFDAARFANWLHNGATNGASTETGAYTLNGATNGVLSKNVNAIWWIPSENEWYKAAFYKGGSTNAGYWLYPTKSNIEPGNAVGGATNQANHYSEATGYAVTQNTAYSTSQNYLTPAGSFSNSAGAYGTFDQCGNLWEWSDGSIGSDRVLRGGSWNFYDAGDLTSSYQLGASPTTEGAEFGFRVATIAAASTNANLSALSLSSGVLNPVFASSTTSYTASVDNAVTSITVTPTVSDATASVKVNGSTVASASTSSPINLNVGSNTINVVVTAQDGTTTKTYTITVTRALSANADLSALTISSGTLDPAFTPLTTGYAASVSNSVASITVTPTVSDATASVTVSGATVASGSASDPINLSVGSNTIDVVVTAQDGTTTKTYSVTVTRAPGTNADLAGLVLSSGTLNPTFASGTTSYAAGVGNAVASVTVTPTAADSTASIKVNSSPVPSESPSSPIILSVGNNTITVLVTAQDGSTTKTYTVTVTRAPSANANLSALVLSTGILSPQFAASTTVYSADVAIAVTSITVTPTVADATASVTVNSSPVPSGTASGAIALSSGANAIAIAVTAQDGTTTKTYDVTVTRAQDTTAPVITLIGSNPMTVAVGATFTDPGATVTDKIDAPRTIYGTGSVNTAVVGQYTLTYNATDSAGNSATPVTRTVNVAVAPQNFGGTSPSGSVQTAGNILNVGFFGAPGIVATADAGNLVTRQGPVSLIYSSLGYVVDADSSTINEAGSLPESSTRTTASARELFDDATFAAPPAPVSWSPVTNQVVSVSPEGSVQANAVYQNTLAAVVGTINGTAATNFINVLNILPDNYGLLAGDTFDDAWEVGQGMSAAVSPTNMSNGIPAWQLYAMGFNPAQAAPAALSTPATTNGYFIINYTRNPYATNYTFAVQESGNLALGFTNMVNPTSITNFTDGMEQITTRGSAPISSTNRQFLRIKITQPVP
ncbi:MAG: cadherin-like beta sandwich domain-containing protein [Chthoniobacterales bacterium]